MSTSVTLPALGESVTEGTVTRWLKQVGDTVEADEPLLEVSTDKVDTEIPSPVAGVLLEIKAAEDETSRSAVSSPSSVTPTRPQAMTRQAARAATRRPRKPSPSRNQSRARRRWTSRRRPKPAPADPAAGTGEGGGGGTEVTLPALGESVTEGTVSRWLKQVGDTVEADEALLEISTDKVDTEIPSPVAGTLLEIKVAEDETVEVGAVLAVIGDASQAGAAPDAEAPSERDRPGRQRRHDRGADRGRRRGRAGADPGQAGGEGTEARTRSEARAAG